MNQSSDHIRKCINIKSKKTPDIQCKSNAVHTDYCSKHWKHPCRFVSGQIDIPNTRRAEKAVILIQRLWRKRSPFLKLFHQGPCISMRSLSNNSTELYSLESVESIHPLYFFSLVDNHKLWVFDIRSLAQMILLGTLKENPYTREKLSQQIIQKIIGRISWLRSRGYIILYTGELTVEQAWRQKILDACMHLESFGFHVSYEWLDMTLEQHINFYGTIYNLWNFRLGLTAAQQEAIIGSTKLFASKKKASKIWWEKVNLQIIKTLTTSSPDKELRRLGATYCMMGIVQVNREAAETFPWIYESFND